MSINGKRQFHDLQQPRLSYFQKIRDNFENWWTKIHFRGAIGTLLHTLDDPIICDRLSFLRNHMTGCKRWEANRNLSPMSLEWTTH